MFHSLKSTSGLDVTFGHNPKVANITIRYIIPDLVISIVVILVITYPLHFRRGGLRHPVYRVVNTKYTTSNDMYG